MEIWQIAAASMVVIFFAIGTKWFFRIIALALIGNQIGGKVKKKISKFMPEDDEF